MAVDAVPVHMRAVASGDSQTIGHYHYDIVTGSWQWDDQLYRMHGYEPGEVPIDLGLILSHKHPDDRDEASHVIEAALLNGEPFSSYQRIVAKDGRVRSVVKVGTGIVDEKLHVVALDGFYIDLTANVRQLEVSAADEAVLAATEHRAAIEQAKGMVMATHRLDPDGAFAMLSWWSMKANMKLHQIAEQLVAAGSAVEIGGPEARVTMDRVLFDITQHPDQ